MVEEEVIAEVEAVQAVYGDDCQVIESYPPHIVVHLKPRTADVYSQQFVEATIRILAGPKYPEELPDIRAIDTKGLDEQRQKNLISCIRNKASELRFGLMLVSVCEEAIEQLSSMNHPDGDCPLCLCALLDEDTGSDAKPFMKLMSCFHCFHCDCIVKWWNWIQMQEKDKISGSSSSTSVRNMQDQQGVPRIVEGKTGSCPVCRKVFHSKDIEHVLDLAGSYNHVDYNETETDNSVLQSDYEKSRRERYESILKLQLQNNGLIEVKRNEVLFPGMLLPQPIPLPSTESNNEQIHSRNKASESSSSVHSESSWGGHGSRKRNSNFTKRNSRYQNTKKEVKQWIRKSSDPEPSNDGIHQTSTKSRLFQLMDSGNSRPSR